MPELGSFSPNLHKELSAADYVAACAAAALHDMNIRRSVETYLAALHPDAAGVRGPIEADLTARAEDLAEGHVDPVTVQGWIDEGWQVAQRELASRRKN